jgi:hypothetical protein
MQFDLLLNSLRTPFDQIINEPIYDVGKMLSNESGGGHEIADPDCLEIDASDAMKAPDAF